MCLKTTFNLNFQSIFFKSLPLGKGSVEKNRLLSGIARISGTPPPNSGNLVLFFRMSKRRFARMTEKSTNDDNDNCHDNYDSYDGNFDNYDEKITKKIYKYYDFSAKLYLFKLLLLRKKKAKKFGQG